MDRWYPRSHVRNVAEVLSGLARFGVLVFATLTGSVEVLRARHCTQPLASLGWTTMGDRATNGLFVCSF